MSSLRKMSLASGLGAAAMGLEIPLVTFDNQTGTSFGFTELNDPVMGGQSTGTWNVDSSGHFGVFDGEVVDVPKLKAPGFIKAAADGSFADASGAADGDLVLKVRSTTPEYKGFRVSFVSGAASAAYSCSGGGSLPFSRGCFKAKFSVPAGADFTEVRIPFKSFSDKWSPATGEQTATCAAEADVCPSAEKLKGIKRMEVWAEGALGKAHLELESISASTSTSTTATTTTSSKPSTPTTTANSPGGVPAAQNTCRDPLQKNLRYNVSSRTEPTVPVAVDPSETLAEAVCCDKRTKVFAEPQFLYQAPDIDLFGQISDSGVTTFYDSACGIPLFKAPVNRTMAEFKADTDEHGWPSFRLAEVLNGNVITDSNGFVYSRCGTHLGSYLPDDKGPRWCMDLVCLAGNPAADTTIII